MLSPSDFLKAGASYIRSPLGIIGLFIAFIYGVAAGVVGASPYLSPDQRWVFVYFCVLFPVVVLGAFLHLVIHHHPKLYSPSDWRDERHLFGLQPAKVKERREAEELALALPTDEGSLVSGNVAPARLAEKRNQFQAGEAHAMAPKETDAKVSTHSQLLSLVREAEQLFFRLLESETAAEIIRNIQVSGPKESIPFDGAIMREGVITFVDVKLVRSLKNAPNAIRSALDNRRLASVFASPSSTPHVRLLVGVITVGLSTDQRSVIRDDAHAAAKLLNADVEIRVYDIDELRALVGD